jgi:hypothetical protein
VRGIDHPVLSAIIQSPDISSLPPLTWSTASLVVLGVELIVGMLFAYGMLGRMTLVGIVGQLPGC